MASYYHISTNQAGKQLQTGTTLLNKIVVNATGSAWTITCYDGTSTSDPVVAALTAQNGGNYDFECTLTKGLFVATTGTTPGDATIVFD